MSKLLNPIFQTVAASLYCWALCLSQAALGGTPTATSPLEVRVWTAELEELPAVESAVIRTLQIEPRSALAHYLMAKIYLRRFAAETGELALLRNASELGQQAIELEPNSDYGYVIIAEVLDIMGQPQNALKILEPSNSAAQGSTWRTTFTRARLNADTFRNGLVLELLDKAMSEPGAPADVIAPYAVGILQEEYAESAYLQQVERWLARHHSKFFQHARAVALAKAERYKEAHLLYQKIYAAEPGFHEARINDGILLFSRLGQAQAGRRLLEGVLVENNPGPSAHVRSVAESHLGLILLQAKDFKGARQHFRAAVLGAADRIEMLNIVSQALKNDGSSTQQVLLLRELIPEMPGVAILHAMLGESLSENLREHEKAVLAFANALVLEPDRSDFYNGMGLAYYRMNSLGKALSLFNTATKVDPQDATAKYNEACVLARLGRPSESLASLREALVLDPRLNESARGDVDFKNIRNMQQFVEITAGSPTLSADTAEAETSKLMLGH